MSNPTLQQMLARFGVRPPSSPPTAEAPCPPAPQEPEPPPAQPEPEPGPVLPPPERQQEPPTLAVEVTNPRRGGRPSKFNLKLAAKACDLVKLGLPVGTASLRLGLSRPTLSRWAEQNPDFAAQLGQAAAEGVEILLRTVQGAARSDPKLACWLLTKLDSAHFGTAMTKPVDQLQDREVVMIAPGEEAPEPDGSGRERTIIVMPNNRRDDQPPMAD